jgi:sterol desaturase/sphingolipid hydroxylase (fatty acid hydroxylase superfamily)
MTLPDPIQLAGPAFILLILVEIIAARLLDRDQYELRDTAASLTMGFVNGIELLFAASLLYTVLSFIYSFRLFDIGYRWWAFALLFFAEDFCFYWFHRLSHEHRLWWAVHVNHHSSQHYNLSTALRQPWFGTVALIWLPWLPLALLGFPVPMILFQKAVNLVYQFWIHTELIGRLPRWVEAVFNTPSHHRVHHASNPRYLDANYGGTLIIWDRLFGTFIAEEAIEPCRYGIVRNIGTFNPLKIALHEWIGLVRDVAGAPGWRIRLGYLFGPPGWRPDGSGRTSATIKAEWRERQTAKDNFTA